MLELHQECPGVLKLVMGLHHVSQGGNQESSGMLELMCGLHHVSFDGD